MCYYHAYTHRCGHTEMVFQSFCTRGQLKQKKCPRGEEGKILTDVKLEYSCAGCPGPKKVGAILREITRFRIRG
ncbi:uncharacterized protein BDR25DRAFT_259364 [Lindgomyces ingoldianus]|uniref:Uncharacterized protein n=1 Tax=Lindgomyces ingoldianus TaxID=673940 RepID=A0ACB6QYC4_9PLEO|nr:uncharacterized protein BDR25DRAFT_259364 [Lindgomyces ingoldianus]KAF2472023.1 hypothetical protein BDR25DRAFT_259364 [Lindgomyces ingoldianus]